MTTQTQSKPYLLYIIIFLLSVIIIGGWFKQNSRDTKELEKQLIKSEKRVDSLNTANIKLSKEITVIFAQIRGLNIKLQNNQTELNNLKKEYQQKENEIDLYNYNQLIKLFEDRYNIKLPQE